MALPSILTTALGRIRANIPSKELAKISAELSSSYIKRDKVGGRVVTSYNQAAVYAMARMPATYGAVYSAMRHTFDGLDIELSSMLDVGAGTGAASFAAAEIRVINSFTCLEREACMSQVGRELMRDNPMLSGAVWRQCDMTNCEMPSKADLVVAAYSLNELIDSDRIRVAEKLFSASNKILLIIEPGTPECYRQLILIRDKLLKIGAKMLSPCTHSLACPLDKSDWCNFSCRIARSKLHKQLKGGDCPYEDEKYCYIAFSKEDLGVAKLRVLRHPIIEKECVKLKLCSAQGIVDYQFKKGDSPIYKTARKVDAGDSIDIAGEPCKEN